MRKVLFVCISLFIASTVFASAADEYLELGRKYSRENNFKKAIEEYTKVIELKPGSADATVAYHNRGSAYFQMSDCGNAVSDLSNSLKFSDYSKSEADPKLASSSAHYMMGFCYLNGNDKLNAYQNFTEAVKVNPFNESAYVLRAKLLLDEGKQADSFEDFLKAREVEWFSYISDARKSALNGKFSDASFFIAASLKVADELKKLSVPQGAAGAMEKISLAFGYLNTVKEIRNEDNFTDEDERKISELLLKTYENIVVVDEICSRDAIFNHACADLMDEFKDVKEVKRSFWQRLFSFSQELASKSAFAGGLEETKQNFYKQFPKDMTIQQLKEKMAAQGRELNRIDPLTGRDRMAKNNDINYYTKGKIWGIKRGTVMVNIDGREYRVQDLDENAKRKLWNRSTPEQRKQLREQYGYTPGMKGDWGRDMTGQMDTYYGANNIYSEMGKLAGTRAATRFMPESSIKFINEAKSYLEVHGDDMTPAEKSALKQQIKEVQEMGYLIGSTELLKKKTQIQGGAQLTLSIVKDYAIGLTRSGFQAGSELVAELANELIAVAQSAASKGLSVSEQIDLLNEEIAKKCAELNSRVSKYGRGLREGRVADSPEPSKEPKTKKKKKGKCSGLTGEERKKCIGRLAGEAIRKGLQKSKFGQ